VESTGLLVTERSSSKEGILFRDHPLVEDKIKRFQIRAVVVGTYQEARTTTEPLNQLLIIIEYCTVSSLMSFLAYFPRFEKIKVSLFDHQGFCVYFHTVNTKVTALKHLRGKILLFTVYLATPSVAQSINDVE
jgi:hypothetical protein